MTITVRELLERQKPVMVSLYMPTYRTSPDREQNPIRFKNLLDELRSQLSNGEGEEILEKLEELVDNTGFWENVKDGLAIFVDNEYMEHMKLAVEMPERVVVGERFHILPLINNFDIFDEYYLLDLSKDRFTLHHFDSEGIEAMEVEGVESRFDEIFDDKDVADGNLNRTDGATSNLHGHQTSSNVEEKETEKFMRHVGSSLQEFIKGQEDYPIIVFGTSENVSAFDEFTKNTLDVYLTIDKPLNSMDEEEAIETLRENLLPPYIESVKEELENLEIALGQEDEGSENLSRIAQEAEHGRIKSFLFKKDSEELDPVMLDKVVSDVILTSGEVITVDENLVEFPREVGAIYRY